MTKNCMLFFIINLFGAFIVNAQLSNIQGVDNVIIRTKKYENIRGSAYLYEDWCQGAITDKNGREYTELLMKYDTHKDRVEVYQEGQTLEINPLIYPAFKLEFKNNESYEIVKRTFSSGYLIPGFKATDYFEILYEGKLKLLKKYQSFFIEEGTSGYGTSDRQKSFQSKTRYFILKSPGSIEEIKPNRKSLEAAFPDRISLIKNFIDKEKSKLKSEKDLVKIIQFIDSN
jgi:hypothetical protein